MRPADNPQAPQKPANLRISPDLLSQARELGINLSATLALAEALKGKQPEQWLAGNRAVIDADNEHVETHGVFSDGLLSF